MVWTQFHDMHSGGGLKTKWAHVFVESDSEAEAIDIFRERIGRDPDHVTCSCCGEDYSVSTEDTLEQATAYERNCAWDGAKHRWVERGDPARAWAKYVPIEEYEKREDILILRSTSPRTP